MDFRSQVTMQQLTDSVGVFGKEYVFSQTLVSAPSLKGDMQVRELEPGLMLYCTQVVDQCDIRTSNRLNPSLKLLVLLDGYIQVRYGTQWHELDASSHPCALIVNLVQQDVFMRQWQCGRPERKFLIDCVPEWLCTKDLHGAVPHLQDHLAQVRWRPSSQMIALANQLHHAVLASPTCDALQKMVWQSRALTVLHEGLEQLRKAHNALKEYEPRGRPSPSTLPCGLSAQAYRRLVDIREWVATTASDGMGLPEIARHTGTSVSYLQRHFPIVAHGHSVATFMREHRLKRASQALEHNGVCVAQAAEVAGYSSVTHFAKAFRAAYGCTPSQWRQRV